MYDLKIPFALNGAEQDIKINPEHRELYAEWVVMADDGNGGEVHVSPDDLTASNSNAVTVSVNKQVAGTSWYEPFDGSPYAVQTNTNIPNSFIPGSNLKVTVDGLIAGQTLYARFYSRY